MYVHVHVPDKYVNDLSKVRFVILAHRSKGCEQGGRKSAYTINSASSAYMYVHVHVPDKYVNDLSKLLLV